MELLIATAWAQNGAPASQEPSLLVSLLPLLVLFALFYLLLIRPQMRRAKEHRKMVEDLAKGDEIVTSGGLAGRIVDIDEHFLSVEIADKIVVKIQKQSVGNVLPKGTLKKTGKG